MLSLVLSGGFLWLGGVVTAGYTRAFDTRAVLDKHHYPGLARNPDGELASDIDLYRVVFLTFLVAAYILYTRGRRLSVVLLAIAALAEPVLIPF